MSDTTTFFPNRTIAGSTLCPQVMALFTVVETEDGVVGDAVVLHPLRARQVAVTASGSRMRGECNGRRLLLS